jgi:hypothetical protein
MNRSFSVTLLACFCLACVFGSFEAEAATSHKKHRADRHSSSHHTADAAPAKPAPVEAAVNIPAAPPPQRADSSTSSGGGGAPPPSRGPSRIDFDDRLVTGQTNKTGSVYLYDRKELKTASMLKMRESFRDEIVGSVYDRD